MEKVNFTWYNYPKHMTGVSQEMFFSNDFKDVTLVSEDKNEIKAHKNILSASSPVLKRLITDNNGNQPIHLDGVKYNELLSLLQFIYLGETRLFKVNMNPFLTAAKKLQVKDLEKNVKKMIAEIKESKLASMEIKKPTTESEFDKSETLKVMDLGKNVKKKMAETKESKLAVKKEFTSIKKPTPNVENEEGEIVEVIDEIATEKELAEPLIQTSDKDKEQVTSKTDSHSLRVGKTGDNNNSARESCMPNKQKISQEVVETNVLENKCTEAPEDKDHDPYMLKPKSDFKSKTLLDGKRKKKEKVCRTLSCNDCNYQTIHKTKLEIHIQVFHLGKRLKCNQCDYESKYSYSLKNHISTKHDGLIFKCQLCDLNYSRNGHLKRHMQMVHEKCETERVRQHKCPECSYSAFRKSHLMRHIEGHMYPRTERIQSRKFQCPQCEYRSFSAAHLKRHMLRKHACPHCGFVTPEFLDLQNHCQNVHGREIFRCKVCFEVQKDNIGLKVHMHDNHGDDSKFECKACDFKFNNTTAYKRHMLFKHKDENIKNIQCKFCPEKFIFKLSLSKHLKYKHAEHIFSCDACNHVSLEKQSLDKHKMYKHGKQIAPNKKQMKSNHTEQTYSCKACDYVCKKELSLQNHEILKHGLEIETKRKILQCKFCPETISKLTFRKHMISQHVEHTFSCDLCDYVGVKKNFLVTHKKMKHSTSSGITSISPSIQVETNKINGMSLMQALDNPTHGQKTLTSSSSLLQQSQQFTNNIDSDVDDIWN